MRWKGLKIMKRLVFTAVVIFALSVTAMYSTVYADPVDRGKPFLAMMGRDGGMMGGGGGMMGGQGYGGIGGNMGGSGFGQGYDNDRNDYAQPYRNNHYRGDSREQQELRDELHRQRQELSEMIHSGNADQDGVDRKMDRIERLESRLGSKRW
jgi:hypothetical protein